MDKILYDNAGYSTLSGIIKGVIYQNQSNGFTILKVFSNGKLAIASGSFFDIPLIDSKIKLTGKFVYHKKYGHQFNFNEYEVSLSTAKLSIIEYLASNIFKGIGKSLANAIYDKFKEETLNIIDNEPERIKEVKGIGDIKINFVLEGIKSSAGLRRAIMFFKPYQFSDYQIKAIYNKFKDKSIKIAKENPYIFTEIKGIGFKKADIMAEKLGVLKNDPNRVKEAIKYLINEICLNTGNTYVSFSDIRNNINDLINGKEDIEDKKDKKNIGIDDNTLKNYICSLCLDNKIITNPLINNIPSNKIVNAVYVYNVNNDKDGNNNVNVNDNDDVNLKINVNANYMDSRHGSNRGSNKLQLVHLQLVHGCQETMDINKLKIYLPVYYYSELRIAKELKRLLTDKNGRLQTAVAKISVDSSMQNSNEVDSYLNFLNGDDDLSDNHIKTFNLTEEQKTAVLNALKYKVSIISGGPGTGKSTIIKTICDMHSDAEFCIAGSTLKMDGLKPPPFSIALTSISGKAAQRLEAIIFNKDHGLKFIKNEGENYHISTIHRLLKASINRETGESYFAYNENNKLPYDLIIIDEISMVDVIMFSNLLKALKDEAKLVLVGDVNQLPSVNPGDVLRDLIYMNMNEYLPDSLKTDNLTPPAQDKRIFPVTFLTKVFRQNEGGLININAHNLLNNKKFITGKTFPKPKSIEAPIYKPYNLRHSEFVIKYKKEYDEKETGKKLLLNDFIDFIKRVKQKRLSFTGSTAHDFNDIQVLTPMRKGDLGYFKLNQVLQDILNPLSGGVSEYSSFVCNGVQFRLNDRVIQKKNNYDLDVFNGDSGYITKIDHIEKTLSVDFSGIIKSANGIAPPAAKGDIPLYEPPKQKDNGRKIVSYDFLDVYDNLSLAYALSIHKSQGSEFDNVIIIFHQSHYMMLKKNLLYTAITRGKKNVVIFGTFKAFSIAMNSKVELRNSGLKERLIEVIK